VADPILSVEGLGKSYRLGQKSQRYTALRDVIAGWFRPRSAVAVDGLFWALKEVSFELKQGEVLGIIGRNGAGKSTLLKLLSRITEPTTGEIRLRGRVASLLEVGTGFHPELTGRENIYLNGAILGMTRREITAKFDEIVAFAEVEKFLDTPVKRYSSGMYVRLAFAVAAHLEPEILIVDEVLAVGDASFQTKCLGKMQTVATEGRTVVLVSHQMDAIQRLASTVMVMDQGQKSWFGPVTEGVAHYLSAADGGAALAIHSDRACITSAQVDRAALADGALKVMLQFESPEPIQSPVFGLVVHDARGRALCGSNTRMHPAENSQRQMQRGTVAFSLPQVPLLSGDYSISLWLNDGLTNLQHLPHAVNFTFLDPQPPLVTVDPEHIGYCKISPHWQIH
jgi:lipopolysaccharide transport system ATP-binding protein